MSEKNAEKAEAFEKCCVCGKIAEVLKDTPIDQREYYVIGAGQLCRKCFFELYVKKLS